MWHDNETTVDYLNFGVVADACAKLLQRSRGAPISVGVSGGWGTGKTSLVRMIAQRLDRLAEPDKNTYVVVTFNPWLYQDFESARSALLQIVGDEVLKRAKEREGMLPKAQRLLKRINILKVAQLGGEAAATVATGIPFGAIGRAIMGMMQGDAEDAEGEPAPVEGLLNPAEPVSLPGEIQAFRDALETLLDELKITLVVFVDDLDRCLPRTAISTLESIRLLLFLKRSAFVIAADNDFIRGAVRMHFAGTGISDEIATNYFDKLIQVPLQVPRLGVNEAKAYLAMLLLQRAHEDEELGVEHFSAALIAVAERLKSSWRGDAVTHDFLRGLVQKDEAKLIALMDLVEGLAPLLVQSRAVMGNPRLMKRFLNTVYLRSELAKPQGIELDLRMLAKWHLVERCDASLGNAIAQLVTSERDGRVQQLNDAEQAAAKGLPLSKPFNDDDPFVKEWLSLEPSLGEADLRPLLHLSRDADTRDFGSDDLTPQGRALRDALVAATGPNQPLAAAIAAAGEAQAKLAMAKAWQLKTPKRTWKANADMVPLLEPCKVFAGLGVKAAELLDEAPIASVGPGIIPTLYAQLWARPVLESWTKSDDLSLAAKGAIAEAKKL
jgi:predicted KAP-like P-loop ATPase